VMKRRHIPTSIIWCVLFSTEKLRCIHSMNNIGGTYFIHDACTQGFCKRFSLFYPHPSNNILCVSRRHISRVLILNTTHVRYGILRFRCKKIYRKNRSLDFHGSGFAGLRIITVLFTPAHVTRGIGIRLFRVSTACAGKTHETVLPSNNMFSMKIRIITTTYYNCICTYYNT